MEDTVMLYVINQRVSTNIRLLFSVMAIMGISQILKFQQSILQRMESGLCAIHSAAEDIPECEELWGMMLGRKFFEAIHGQKLGQLNGSYGNVFSA